MTSLPTDVIMSVGGQQITDPTSLVTRTETNGGFSQCTFSLDGLINRGIELADKISIYNTTYRKYAFVGRIQSLNFKQCAVTATRSTQDRVVRYSTVPQDQRHPTGIMAGKVYPNGTPYLVVLQEALTLCPQVFDGGIGDPGLQFVGDSVNVGGYTPEQILNYICAMTQALVTPLQWHIRGANDQEVLVVAFADLGARYFVDLPEDQIEELYDLGVIINTSTVEFGNDDVEFLPEAGQAISYSAIKIIRDKYLNSSQNIKGRNDAVGLAGNILTRFGQFRSAQDTLTIKCNENPVRVVPPVYTNSVDDWPLHLIEAGHTINLRNRTNPSPYNAPTKNIVGTEYDWDSGVLTCRCGEPVGYDAQINNIVDYNVNRLYLGPASGATPRWGNHPLADADVIPIKGPTLADIASRDPTNQPGNKPMEAGVPTFTNNGNTQQTTEEMPFGEVIHPGLIADKGLEINYSFGIDEVGWKGGPWSIPGTLRSVKFSLWLSTAEHGLQADTVVFEIYKRKKNEAVSTLVVRIPVTGVAEDELILATTVPLPSEDYQLVFKVVTAASLAEIISVTLHATKLFPGLKV